jgi:hypothetical protein
MVFMHRRIIHMGSQYTIYKGKDFEMISYGKANCLGPISLVSRKSNVFITCAKENWDLGCLKSMRSLDPIWPTPWIFGLERFRPQRWFWWRMGNKCIQSKYYNKRSASGWGCPHGEHGRQFVPSWTYGRWVGTIFEPYNFKC